MKPKKDQYKLDPIVVFKNYYREKKHNKWEDSYQPVEAMELLKEWHEREYKPRRCEYKGRIAHSRLFSITYMNCGNLGSIEKQKNMINRIINSWLSIGGPYHHKRATFNRTEQNKKLIENSHLRQERRDNNPFDFLISIEESESIGRDENGEKLEVHHVHAFLNLDEAYQFCDFFRFSLPACPETGDHLVEAYALPIPDRPNDRSGWWSYILKDKTSFYPEGIVNTLNHDEMMKAGVFSNMSVNQQRRNLIFNKEVSIYDLYLEGDFLLKKGIKNYGTKKQVLSFVHRSLKNRYRLEYQDNYHDLIKYFSAQYDFESGNVKSSLLIRQSFNNRIKPKNEMMISENSQVYLNDPSQVIVLDVNSNWMVCDCLKKYFQSQDIPFFSANSFKDVVETSKENKNLQIAVGLSSISTKDISKYFSFLHEGGMNKILLENLSFIPAELRSKIKCLEIAGNTIQLKIDKIEINNIGVQNNYK